MPEPQARPIYLDLLRIRLPVTAWASFAHRVTGLLLALALPGLIYLLALSLRDAQGFAKASALIASPAIRLPMLLLLWSFAHHLLAGVRFLLLDVDIGTSKRVARLSAWVVNIGGLLIALAVLVAFA
jgi:succinate dehydrogenase / fumarate reductase cytochrome b subunit